MYIHYAKSPGRQFLSGDDLTMSEQPSQNVFSKAWDSITGAISKGISQSVTQTAADVSQKILKAQPFRPAQPQVKIVTPPPYSYQDNTALWIGGAALGSLALLFLLRK